MPSPESNVSPDVSITTRVKDFLKSQAKSLEEDMANRGTWAEWQDYFERRRFCQEFRDPQWPWPGSSDIVMPLIDKVMDKAAPRFFQTVLGDRPVQANAIDRRSQQNSDNVEMFTGHLIKSPEGRVLKQLGYHIDDFHQHGWAPLKSFWKYQRRPTPIHLRRNKLPSQLQQIIPVQNERDANRLELAAQQSGQRVAILTRKEFRERRGSIAALIRSAYNLEETQRDDRTVAKILEWFRDGAKEAISVMGSTATINQPALAAVPPYDCIFPESTADIQEADRIAHRIRMSRMESIRTAHDNGWNISLLSEILKDRKRGDRQSATDHADELHRQSERDRYHLPSNEWNDSEVLYEVYTWYADTEFGEQRRISYIVHEDRLDQPLKIKSLSRASGRFPWHITKMERRSRRIMGSRGLPEKLNDIDAEVTLNHRAKHNRAQILTSPSFAYKPSSGFNPDQVRWIPGGMYPMMRPQQDIAPLPVPPMDAYEDREEAILRTWAEEYVGTSDFGLANPLSNLTEARTAREISAITQSAALGALIVGSDFGQSIEEIADEWFDMFHQFGPDEIWIARTGAEPMRLSKVELAGNYQFSMAASINSGGPEGRARKIMETMSLIIEGQLDQRIGIRYELDVGETIRAWMEATDPRLTARIMRERTPEEIQQIQQQQQQRQALMERAMTNQGLSLEEMDIVRSELQKSMPHKGAQKVDLGKTLAGAGR